jgi:hypothetical protein
MLRRYRLLLRRLCTSECYLLLLSRHPRCFWLQVVGAVAWMLSNNNVHAGTTPSCAAAV